MKNFQLLMSTFAGLAIAMGCASNTTDGDGSEGSPSGGEDSDEEGDDDDDDDDDADDLGDGDGDGDGGGDGDGDGDDTGATSSLEPYELSGLIVGDDGEPVTGAAVLFCGPEPPLGGCLYSITEPDGAFLFAFDVPGTFKLSVNPSEQILQENYSTVARQVHLVPGQILQLEDPIVFPKTGDRQLVADGPVLAVDDMLTFTVDAEAFTLPFGNDAEPYMAAKLIGPEKWRSLGLEESSLDGEEVFAMWALNPYDARSETVPIGFEVSNEPFGLEAGSEVSVYRVDHNLGLLVPVEADARVTDDGASIVSADGKGLEHVTWLALVQK